MARRHIWAAHRGALKTWAEASRRPLVLFLDEIDALQDAALISTLRQLRDGYQRRPTGFPWSLAVIGLRDVRDYKVAIAASPRPPAIDFRLRAADHSECKPLRTSQ